MRLAEAPSHGKPALAYDRNSKGATAYLLRGRNFEKGSKTEVSRKIMES